MNSLDYNKHTQHQCNVDFQVLLYTLRKKKNPTKITLSIEDLNTNNQPIMETLTTTITEKTALVPKE